MPDLSLRPARWADCWYLYRLRKHLDPAVSFRAHLLWFAWRVTQPNFWICERRMRYPFCETRRVGYLRVDRIAGLAWYSVQRDPDAPPGPGRWMLEWLEKRGGPVYGVIQTDNPRSLKCVPQPRWRHHDMGTWTLVELAPEKG